VTPALAVENLAKRFPPALSGWKAMMQPFAAATVQALEGVSFAVQPGEALAIVGANGAGKSTLLRILATLLLPTAGRAVVAGCDVERDPAGVRRQIGFHTGADGGFYSRLSALENLRFFARLNNLHGHDLQSRIDRLVSLMSLGEMLDRQVRTLSTGTVHRLSLARALLHAPSVLLLDEPTRSLDPLAAAEFRRFLRSEILERQEVALLFTTHTLAEVTDLGGRVAVLHQGRLLACDRPERLVASTGAASLEQAMQRLIAQASPATSEESQ
jgi:ABC-type multidrug transport system ATPase subunit